MDPPKYRPFHFASTSDRLTSVTVTPCRRFIFKSNPFVAYAANGQVTGMSNINDCIGCARQARQVDKVSIAVASVKQRKQGIGGKGRIDRQVAHWSTLKTTPLYVDV